MTTKTKTLFRPAAPRPEESQTWPWYTSPCSTEECLQRIQALNARISGYVEYIVKVDNLTGTSAEAKDKAVASFYDRMVALERLLGRIQEELQLG
jgi:hypothetical protein